MSPRLDNTGQSGEFNFLPGGQDPAEVHNLLATYTKTSIVTDKAILATHILVIERLPVGSPHRCCMLY